MYLKYLSLYVLSVSVINFTEQKDNNNIKRYVNISENDKKDKANFLLPP